MGVHLRQCAQQALIPHLHPMHCSMARVDKVEWLQQEEVLENPAAQ